MNTVVLVEASFVSNPSHHFHTTTTPPTKSFNYRSTSSPSHTSNNSNNIHPNPLSNRRNQLTIVGSTPSTTSSDGVDSSSTSSQSVEVEFPPALSTIDTLKRAGKFWASVLPIIGSYYTMSAEIQFREILTGETITAEEEEIRWNEQHRKGADKIADTITSLKGFYIKTAQIIASRQDLFPKEYTEALSDFTDNVDPIPAELARAVVEKELLHVDEKFEDVFSSFDPIPLGAASVAQVHKATLTAKYGGPKEVAIKIQRPSIESKLMGDIANLKTLAKPLRDAEYMPLDYYTVFCELEKQLGDEFDFVAEASAMTRIYDTMTRDRVTGMTIESPLVIPRPVEGLVSKRVLVMDYLEGVPLSRAREEMLKKGIDPDGAEAKLFGRKLLKALTYTFGRCILETGFFHADPHPGNIFVLDDGRVGLIDFGQVKQISGRARQTLAKVMVALADRVSDTNPPDLKRIGDLAIELGVEFKPEAQVEAPPAVAMWLFDGTVNSLPGGYDDGELSPNSPVKELKAFPQDLVLVGRSTILIKGLSNRLGIPWSLAEEWAPLARNVLELPKGDDDGGGREVQNKVRFRQVLSILKNWSTGKATRGVMRLSPAISSRVASMVLRIQERRERKKRSKKP
eukprot:CAMPEP_0198271814 /NCGR_PEP_ID=MMETSP1447-20131203/50669_1 /TAXON_ID=420782 /ORGANISM="Chaetoceros dichaeta, Strain CCMP1751" /LENGTH=626 /DNA_ID=CAMNT_0043964623 /DNA_START=117 /DNA_END=1997 /DNA_ORIENTATION=+